MKRYILSFCAALVLAASQGFAGVTLTVPDVEITQGGTANVVIRFDLGASSYTAYQLDIAYPEGISAVNDTDGNPAFVLGDAYAKGHTVSSFTTSGGQSRFQCFSIDSDPFTRQSGTLLTLPIKALKSLALGTYQATISPIEFVETDATPDRPEAVTFNITVWRTVVLDETSTLPPTAATDVDVVMRRTIAANEWGTICLPFAMTEAQVKSAFGQDVKLGDFTGYDATEDAAGNVVGIAVNFTDATAMEANHPYIIKVTTAVQEFTAEGVDIAPADDPTVARVQRTRKQWSEMTGTYVAGTTLPAEVLFISGGQFWYSAGRTKMQAFRAYFDFSDVLSDVEGSGIKMFFDGVETGIGNIENSKLSNSKCYDLGGRQIAEPQQRGTYVVNGRKVLVR